MREKIESNDAVDRRRLAMASDKWDIEETGARIWPPALDLRHREGGHSHVENGNAESGL